jgi:hypothetical protein
MPRKGHKRYSKENPQRVQIPKSLKKQMKRLHEEGHKPAKIRELLKLGDIPKSTFYDCLNYNQADETHHKVRNRTVAQVQVEFEKAVTELYRQRARSRGFGRQYVN